MQFFNQIIHILWISHLIPRKKPIAVKFSHDNISLVNKTHSKGKRIEQLQTMYIS